MTKPAVALAAALLVAAGCGADEHESSGRLERCVDRLLSRSDSTAADEERVREYARTTYCERFDADGWVHEDGTLSIDAQHWLDRSGTCATGTEGEPTRTVPCEEHRRNDPILDCALLHHVRVSEVRTYLEQLDRTVPVRCDDGTPVDELGVP
jgi:hypothetical protein